MVNNVISQKRKAAKHCPVCSSQCPFPGMNFPTGPPGTQTSVSIHLLQETWMENCVWLSRDSASHYMAPQHPCCPFGFSCTFGERHIGGLRRTPLSTGNVECCASLWWDVPLQGNEREAEWGCSLGLWGRERLLLHTSVLMWFAAVLRNGVRQYKICPAEKRRLVKGLAKCCFSCTSVPDLLFLQSLCSQVQSKQSCPLCLVCSIAVIFITAVVSLLRSPYCLFPATLQHTEAQITTMKWQITGIRAE